MRNIPFEIMKSYTISWNVPDLGQGGFTPHATRIGGKNQHNEI